MIRSLIFLFTFISSCLVAAQYIPMDPTEVMTANLSSKNHNRIGIVGDRISRAFFRSSNISVEVEETTGQLFVQAIRPNCPATTLSIVSCTGVVQELELCFSESPSEIILLQPTIDISEVCRNNLDPSSLGNSSLTELVDNFLKGTVPTGYTTVEDPDEPFCIRQGLKMQRLARLVNSEQIVFIYRLNNVSKKSKYISECQVNVVDGDWVFLDRNKLNPDECAIVLIGCMR